MIFIVTNRNIVEGKTSHKLFGDDFNAQGPEVIRVAKAEYDTEWKLTLFDEDTESVNSPDPSYEVFKTCASASKPCVVFVHGFNQSLKKNLDKCREIESYGVNVIAFSWPSNPGPNFILRAMKEYKRARKNSRRSVVAMERFLDKLVNYVECRGSAGEIKTLVVHSLGNYLLQNFVLTPDFENQTGIFKNVVLHQADADNPGHAGWVDKLGKNSRVIITLNETDDVLDFSDIFNPNRIGNTASNLCSSVANYYDFTHAEGADDSHRLWHKPALENGNIKEFFARVFHGRNVRRAGMGYNAALGCYEVS